jgi:16S rRNA (cytosine1402-N4)-methyltransferase
MAEAALAGLNIRPEGTYVDCTAGAGGHAALIAAQLSGGQLIALDRDESAVALATERLDPFPQARVIHANYGQLGEVLDELGMTTVDGILIDAGVSSMQLDRAERGFSFQGDGPLDMRMDTSQGLPARKRLPSYTVDELTKILKVYGDVRPAKRIARQILARAEGGTLNTTEDLRQAVCEALDFVKGTPDEIRTVFQAIRMAVNEELENLEQGIRAGIERLNAGGRLVVLSFHSGEDRVVKQLFKTYSQKHQELFPDGRVKSEQTPLLKRVTRKPLLPEEEEVRRNPRAKSVKLRIVERLVSLENEK